MSEKTMDIRPSRFIASPAALGIVRLIRLALNKLSRTAQPSDRCLSIEEQLVIGSNKTLLLVNCGGRRFLLATTGDTITPMVEVRPLVKDSFRGVEPGIAKRRGCL